MDADKRELIGENRRLRARVDELERMVRALQEQVQVLTMAATNYRGEQSIRPAVVNRKVWGGNRTWLGAWAQSVFMLVIGTCLPRRIDPMAFFIQALTSPRPLLLAQPPP